MASEQVFPALATPFAGAGARVIASPFQFVADADTFLRVTSVCSASGVQLAVQGRRIDDRGELKAITETHTPASNRSAVSSTIKPGPGAILNLTVFATSGAPLVGQCYVMVQLLRSTGATAIVLGQLLGGYVTTTQGLGFPGSPIVASTEGEPAVRRIVGTAPAAGAEFSESVPTGARWELLLLDVTFQASAVVAQRTMDLELPRSTSTRAPLLANVVPVASEFWRVAWGQSLENIVYAGKTRACASLPQGVRLSAGQAFVSWTDNFDVGDQYAAPEYTVREWLEVS